MKKCTRSKLIAYGILLCSLISGCSASPAYLLPYRLSMKKDTLFRSFPELTEKENIVKIAEETGISLGYRSSGIDCYAGYLYSVTLKRLSDSEIKQDLLPGGTKTEITVKCPTPKGLAAFKTPSEYSERKFQELTTLTIEMKHRGYWGAGGEEEAEKIFNEFIDKFLERARVEK